MRRLTEEQYRNVIHDVFGEGIAVAGRFDPLVRSDGLVAIGASQTSIASSSFERYHALARSIASQVVDDRHRATLIPCAKPPPTVFDAGCASRFFAEVGRLLYRRPLSPEQISAQVRIAEVAARSLSDFDLGVGSALTGLLVSPEFLFVADQTEADPQEADAIRLDAYSRASRLSLFLWNTSPDKALLASAAKGELYTEEGAARQVERMLASDRLDAGVRAFFSDMLALENFRTLEKDPVIYPAFGQRAVADAREQILRILTHQLIDKDRDYRDIFTTREIFLTGALGFVYRAPVDLPDGGWVPYELTSSDPRAGIQMQAGFLALNSHPGRSSPTLRGKAVRELLLCQGIPAPPADVNFTAFNDPSVARKSARERLNIHSTNPTCAGCHKIMDPLGLAMEQLDGAGQIQDADNGTDIDPRGDIDGIEISGPIELGKALHDNPAAAACLVKRIHNYALGRSTTPDEREWITYLTKSFAKGGYRLRPLLREIATSNAFYAVSASNGDNNALAAAVTDPALSFRNPR